jgi:hypothetical protein
LIHYMILYGIFPVTKQLLINIQKNNNDSNCQIK